MCIGIYTFYSIEIIELSQARDPKLNFHQTVLYTHFLTTHFIYFLIEQFCFIIIQFSRRQQCSQPAWIFWKCTNQYRKI